MIFLQKTFILSHGCILPLWTCCRCPVENMKSLFTPKYLFLLLSVSIVSVSVLGNIAFADVPAGKVHEVKHLLEFVKTSGCIINRNGSNHPAEQAIEHIEMKYDYFRDRINNTEDFIEYSATKSTMSGDYYTVTCPGKKAIRTQDWLMGELKRFRAEQE